MFGGPEEKEVNFELYDGLIDLVEADMDVEIGEKVYDPMTGVDDGPTAQVCLVFLWSSSLSHG